MSSTRIYFCGETVADMKENNEGSGEFQLNLGGSLFHGATGAKRAVDREKLGFHIGFVTPLANDMFGDRFFKVLTDMQIDTSGIKRVNRNTTVAFISIRPGKENAFSFYSSKGADEGTTLDDLPASFGEPGDRKIFCCGSISTVIEPARFAWLEFARKRREESLVFYDLNTRPSIAKDPAAYREIVKEWARTAHIMKASDADIGWAYPGMKLSEVAAIWLCEGAHMAVFTKGVDGAEAYTKKLSASAAAIDLDAPNTVGAGDNFNAGFAINLAKGGHFLPEDIINISESQLRQVLSAANNNAVYHLMSNGAQKRQKAS